MRSAGTAAPAIGDLAFLSDCHSSALVDRQGNVVWWCVPRFDSASVFGSLLDDDAGHWTLQPATGFTSHRAYAGDTLVLRTVFTTDAGEVAVTDALALEPGAREHDIGERSPHVLLRRVEGLSGTVTMRCQVSARMEYGRTAPHLRAVPGGVEAWGGPATLTCLSGTQLTTTASDMTAQFEVVAGQVVDFSLRYSPSNFALAAGQPAATIEDTQAGWESWTALHTGYDGAYPDDVRRSSLVLQGLTYQPSGGIVAAATTSLPERMGGDLNWDYRYVWVRDLSLTARSLWLAACPREPSRLLEWLSHSAGNLREDSLQVMYGVEGERDLSEHTLDHLAGYRDSRPVRVGNGAWEQKQLDVLGEVLDAAYLLRDQLGDLDPALRAMLVAMAERAADHWTEPDAGMWEARDKQRHYTSSKVMCWVALDRAVRLAPMLGSAADVDRWAAARDEIHAAVVEKAWSDQAGAYAGAFGSDDLDASVLLLPLVDFLPANDERMRATIEAVAEALGANGLVRRWAADPSGFLISTYWLVECLALAGEHERAHEWFRSATAHANDLGLLAEEADPASGELLGNYPQAFSHVGLINAAWRLGQAAGDQGADT